MKNPIIFSTAASRYFADLIGRKLGITVGEIESKRFGGEPDGELYNRFKFDDRMALLNRDVILVISAKNDEEYEMLYRLGSEAVRCGARKLICVVPFFGYAGMERSVKPLEVVSAKVAAVKLSSIPQAMWGNWFLLMDLHVPGISYYFEGNCRVHELYAGPTLIEAVLPYVTQKTVFGSADLGRPAWVNTFARYFGTRLVLVDKGREGEKVEVNHVIGNVKDTEIIIYDDMTRSGTTLIEADKAYRDNGALKTTAVLSHAAFNSEKVITKIQQSPIEKVIITNTHPMSRHPAVVNSEKFVVIDVSAIFADAIQQLLE